MEKALKELTQSGLLKRDNRRGTFVNNGVTLEGAEAGSGLIAAYVIGIDNPLWASALRGIEDVLRQHGFHLLPSSYGESMEQLRGLVKGAMTKNVDGVIMCPPTGPQHNEELAALIETLERNGTQVIFLDRHVYELDIPFVASDNIAGAYRLTKRLIALGHERILFIRNSD
ncbi:LacI family transcriptional regulator [Paenibacillus taihuensis]|uniref:LacI family transcriptional regulator n=1 Tax=Paenibacillus taihuensis TaxID=1156355 RepID=A0A3D9PYU8_9BACL|nr:LacI family transcriptional regulator [Paenibacillus taihuensis]